VGDSLSCISSGEESSYLSYEEIEALLVLLANEIADAGIGSQGGRLQYCTEQMRELLEIKNGAQMRRSESEYFSVLYEAAELAEIAGAFSRFGDAARHRLQMALKGNAFYESS
jgi:hypothetical protein